MKSKLLNNLAKNAFTSLSAGFIFSTVDYINFQLTYKPKRIPLDSTLSFNIENHRIKINIDNSVKIFSTQHNLIAASANIPFTNASAIVFNQQRIKNLSTKTNLDPERIYAAVLAHENAHIKEKHKLAIVSGSVMLHNLVYDLSTYLRLSSNKKTVLALFTIATAYKMLCHSCEYRADKVAAQNSAEINQSLKSILSSLSQNKSTLFSNHPANSDRIANLENSKFEPN